MMRREVAWRVKRRERKPRRMLHARSRKAEAMRKK